MCYHPKTQPVACTPLWMSPKFPCDITAFNTSKVLFDCRERRLEAVPRGITGNATDLDLSENAIKTIDPDAFSGLLNLTWLNLNWANKNKNKNVAIMANFKNLTKLRELKLNGLCLKEVPQTIPVSVKVLELVNNQIKHLTNRSLARLTNLTQLWLSKNCYFGNLCGQSIEIENNSFANLIKLRVLDLSFNNLSHVPKGLPRSLNMLNLTVNRIQHIFKDDFSGLCHLNILKLQGNCPRCQNSQHPCVPCPNGSLDIDSDAFENLTHLDELNLAANSLEHLNPSWFKSLTKLRKLFLAENFLIKAVTEEKAVFLTYLPRLEVIDISFNFFTKNYPETISLSKEFSNLTSLKTFHMEGMVFKTLDKSTLEPLYELKNLTALNLGTNFIIKCDPSVFGKFHHLKLIYLAENRLYPIPEITLQKPRYGYPRADLSDLSFIKPNPYTYELTHELIKQECFEAGRVISLSSNNLFFISPNQFEGYGDVACLNLSGNGFSAALNGTEFSSLPDLTYLDLSFNKVDLAYDDAFKELKKLEVLDLSYNPHYFKAFGLTLSLNFMKNLPVLRVLNMSHNSISTLTTKQMHSTSLAELQFTHNSLGVLWKHSDGSYKKLFTNLTNLTVLDISHNNIKHIQEYIYENLPRNLTALRISHNQLSEFLWNKLKCFPKLNILDLSYNSLTYLSGDNSTISNSLTLLDLRQNNIFYLENSFFNGLKSLETLGLGYNKLNIINQTTFELGPESKLKTLFLSQNPFQCTCESLDFILWIGKNRKRIPSLTTAVTCGTPAKDRNKPLLRFDLTPCVNDNQAFQMYILTSVCIITFMFAATIAHLFYWDASYILHYLNAKLKGYKSLRSPDNIYDVFVTYDTKDPHVSEWVMRNLRVKLEEEGDKQHPLCLEERDWTPGVPLVDNLMQSIRYSRKTLFVLTRGYVETAVFKLAMYLAHQRLLDENVDVIVLLMLEPVLQHSHFLNLRKRLCEKSVVEWPRTAAAEPWFWQNLRNVVRVDNQIMYNKSYSKFFTGK